MVAPGTEQVMEDLFTHYGAHQNCYRVNLSGQIWSEIVCAIISDGYGTALAYVKDSGEVVTSPPAREKVHGDAIIVMVRHESEPTGAEIIECVGKIAAE